MIRINTMHIGALPMPFSGEENTDFLELSPNGYPKPCGKLKYDFLATLAGDDLLLTGSMKLEMIAECARCLDEFPVSVNLGKVCHLFEGVRGKMVDLAEALREDILLDMPAVFHCSEDCKGLCTGCGANLNHEKCQCTKKKKNAKKADASPAPEEESPWSALDGLSSRKK